MSFFRPSLLRRRKARLAKKSRSQTFRPGLERLEERAMLAVVPSVAANVVTFTGDGAADALILRVNGTNLEFSTDGGTSFSADLDPVNGGTQSRNATAITQLNIDL